MQTPTLVVTLVCITQHSAHTGTRTAPLPFYILLKTDDMPTETDNVVTEADNVATCGPDPKARGRTLDMVADSVQGLRLPQ